jgi:hypothetical protein
MGFISGMRHNELAAICVSPAKGVFVDAPFDKMPILKNKQPFL